ncbi:tetratricopeptide repeat protein [Azospirillum thermophilum]|uniref:Tetratricopeptide repeat protein n=1 Tax=Azospirillum thermophilum TaxID=2202148 RepID=A0A2S2D0P2_9PROT|nr:tetratricopeptide repeat protein [Azospirillum thermophilum]AWK90258.1 hypothetical protein DEW08_30070 [Azospirillum thermophilum]
MGQTDPSAFYEAWRRRIRDDALANYQFEMGLANRNAGAPDVAIACFRRAIDARPDMAEAHLELVRTLQTLGRAAEAQAALTAGQVARPGFEAEGYFRLGKRFFEQDHMAEAEQAFLAALERAPEHAPARSYLVLLDGWRLNVGGMMDGIRRIPEGAGHDPDIAHESTRLGFALFRQMLLKPAIALFDLAARFDPDNATEAVFFAAIARHGSGDAGGQPPAVLDEGMVRKLTPLIAKSMFFGMVRNEFPEAGRLAAIATAVDPASTVSAGRLAQALAAQGRTTEAAAWATRALRLHPRQSHALLARALCAQATGDVEAALFLLQQAVDTTMDGAARAEARLAQGRALIAAGRPDDAAQALADGFRAGEPTVFAEYLLTEQVLAHLAGGNRARAAALLRLALARMPAFAPALRALEEFLRSSGQEHAARTVSQRAAAL